MNERPLLRQLRTILADYLFRVEQLGPEAFRLRGESLQDWERNQRRVALALSVLDATVEGRIGRGLGERGTPQSVLRAMAQERLDHLRRRLAALHAREPGLCQGVGCPCCAGAAEAR